jgi:hypothetical protein
MVGKGSRAQLLCGYRQVCDLPPHLEALQHFLTIRGSREPVAPRAEVLGNGFIGGEKPLRVSGGLEPLHAPFPLTGGWMGIFSAMVEIPMLAVFHTGQDFAQGRPITPELVQ